MAAVLFAQFPGRFAERLSHMTTEVASRIIATCICNRLKCQIRRVEPSQSMSQPDAL